MSAQSIYRKTPDSLKKSYEKKLIKLTKQENLQKRFMIGTPASKDEFLHTFLMYEKMHNKNCQVYDYIWNKIEGKVPECTPKNKNIITLVKKCKEKEVCEEPIEHCTPVIEW